VKFFDKQGEQIDLERWLKIYEPSYFFGGPILGHRINARNQSSQFVEDTACALLSQTSPLSQDDLTFIMAWKMGMIDHRRSEASKKVEYLYKWPATLLAPMRFATHNFSRSIPWLARNMSTILRMISEGKSEYLFECKAKGELTGFGYVYIVTILFFVTQGAYPIYDKFAHIAALAIANDLRPGSYVQQKELTSWADYLRYLNLLRPLGQSCPQQFQSPPMLVARPVDRSLWVYGHFFNQKNKSAVSGCR
jgi:hypothetical protein